MMVGGRAEELPSPQLETNKKNKKKKKKNRESSEQQLSIWRFPLRQKSAMPACLTDQSLRARGGAVSGGRGFSAAAELSTVTVLN